MDGKIDIFTIMFLVLAVVIILKLRSVLGRRTSDDEARIDRNRALERARAAGKSPAGDKVVALPRLETLSNIPLTEDALRRAGFLRHRQAPLIVKSLDDQPFGLDVFGKTRWRIMGGDVDTF